MNYGVPYKGSKNLVAAKLSEAIPSAENFYDLFAGGCAVTHRMLIEERFTNYFANDLDGQGLRLFTDAISGKYGDERRWISREDFYRLKDTDPYVSCCWSFGNNQKDYMYSKEIEPWKKALHCARVLGDFSLMEEFGIHADGTRADIIAHRDEYKRKYIRWWLSKQEYTEEELDALIAKCKGDIAVHMMLVLGDASGLKAFGVDGPAMVEEMPEVCRDLYIRWWLSRQPHGTHDLDEALARARGDVRRQKEEARLLQRLQRLQSLQSLQRLQRLQRLQSLERLQRLQRLQTSFVSYDEVEILPDSVIYCDPPYRGTDGYKNEFDHERLYDWCCRQTELVLVSEYDIPSDRFTEVWSKEHRSRLSGTANNGVTERLFVPTRQLAKYNAMMHRVDTERKPRRFVQLELFPEINTSTIQATI